MDQAEITRLVQERFGGRVLRAYVFRGQHAVTIAPYDLRDVALFLRDDRALDFDMLVDIGGVDYLSYGDDRAWRFEVAYQFYSLAGNHRTRVKVAVPDESVAVPSLWDVWRVANWMEREVFDQYGIRFEGHPNLRRILNHEDFVGHPLRKDYPIHKRQKCLHPIENLLTDDPEHA
jgi:NADH-quinone oxidoreductase subunit C